MNAGIENTDHPSIIYYDSDYPSKKYSRFPENFDKTTESQGLAYDIDKYKQLVQQNGQSVLELCCGTGRVALPLAESGYSVTAVDFSDPLLKEFQKKIDAYQPELNYKIQLINQDITKLSLNKKDFDIVICAFNSLLCIPDFKLQQQVLMGASKHLRKEGTLVLDLMNPLTLNFKGDSMPTPFFTRINPHTGNPYTRFAALSPMQTNQKQKLYGWYDEIEKNGIVKRQNYELWWRPIFRYEIELMLEKAGFKIDVVYGGHRDEVYEPSSEKMFVQALKV